MLKSKPLSKITKECRSCHEHKKVRGVWHLWKDDTTGRLLRVCGACWDLAIRRGRMGLTMRSTIIGGKRYINQDKAKAREAK